MAENKAVREVLRQIIDALNKRGVSHKVSKSKTTQSCYITIMTGRENEEFIRVRVSDHDYKDKQDKVMYNIVKELDRDYVDILRNRSRAVYCYSFKDESIHKMMKDVMIEYERQSCMG